MGQSKRGTAKKSGGKTRSMRVPYLDLPSQFRPIRRPLLKAVETVLARGNFIQGEPVAEFERRFADLCGVRHAIGVANGTDALVLSFKALGIGPGDEVITAPNSFIASASSVVLAGARPVFADVRPDMNIDPAEIEKRITRRTKAILPVHLTGKCADMNPILDLARRRGIPVVEDAAQSVGSMYQKRPAGSFGVVGCFSMHPLKNLSAAGDAGVIVTSDSGLAEKLRLLRNHGLRTRDEAAQWGYNSRLDTIQAAVLNCKLTHLPKILARRRHIAHRYIRALAHHVDCPVETPADFHTYHLFIIQCDRRKDLQAFLAERGIDTRIHYPIPLHLQPCAASLGYRQGDFPVCERMIGRILSLPVHQALTDAQVDHVSRSIIDFYLRQPK